MAIENFLAVCTDDTAQHEIIDLTGNSVYKLSGLFNDIDDETNIIQLPSDNLVFLNYDPHGCVLDRNFNVLQYLHTPSDSSDQSAFNVYSPIPTRFYDQNNVGGSDYITVVDYKVPDPRNRHPSITFSEGEILPQSNWINNTNNVTQNKFINCDFNGIDSLIAVLGSQGLPYNYALTVISAKSGARLDSYSLPSDLPNQQTLGDVKLIDTPQKIVMVVGGDAATNGVWLFNKTTKLWTLRVQLVNHTLNMFPFTSGRNGRGYQFDTSEPNSLFATYENNLGHVSFMVISALDTDTPVVTTKTTGFGTGVDFTWDGKTVQFGNFTTTAAWLPSTNKVATILSDKTPGGNNKTAYLVLFNLTTELFETTVLYSCYRYIDTVNRLVLNRHQITGTVTGPFPVTVSLLTKQGHVLSQVSTSNGTYTLPCLSPDPQKVLVIKSNGDCEIHDNVTPTVV
jgi:hypothetical protein